MYWPPSGAREIFTCTSSVAVDQTDQGAVGSLEYWASARPDFVNVETTPDGRSRGDVAGALEAAAQVLRERRSARDDAIAFRRNDLRVDVLRRAVNAQPMNALERDSHPGATRATLSLGLFLGRHSYFFFASFRTICSLL